MLCVAGFANGATVAVGRDFQGARATFTNVWIKRALQEAAADHGELAMIAGLYDAALLRRTTGAARDES